MLQDPTSARDAYRLEALLDQIDESAQAKWALTQRNEEHPNPLFSVKAIQWMLDDGYNVSRIRFLRGLSQYRVLFGYAPKNDHFYLLAVVKKRPLVTPPDVDLRDFYDYERDHPTTARILNEYDDIPIPRIR
ncbi:hypothetical protein PanNE5_29510 [Pandoraea sp. NE5]|nr:hypothetical protein PanNE5_29510 [Pandoraea sp. NE5]